MINSDPPAADAETGAATDAAVLPILRIGAPGAVVLAGITTAVLVAIWFTFYLLIFLPRAAAP
jgi:hypothetical protein